MQPDKLFPPAKFKPPILAADFLSRDRLQARLAAALTRPVTLVQAPSGYGKSSAVADFLGRQTLAHHWINLSADDDEAGRFVSLVRQALFGVAGSGGQVAENLLAAILQEKLDDDGPLALVLDDYHHISDGAVHALLRQVVEARFEGFHLVLISRAVPPLPLARWRLHELLLEVNSADLRFDAAETAQFLAEPAGAAPGEGWIAYLKLRQLAGVQAGPAAADYLFAEVWQQQPAEVQAFLLPLAVVDEFSLPLAAAVTGRRDAAQMVNYLLRAGLFLTPLDAERRWFRFHQLFRDMLLRQGGDQAAARRRASQWFETEGYIPLAVDLAVAADDWPRAIDLMERYGQQLAEQGDLHHLRQWIAALPDGHLAQYPTLCLKLALPFVVTGNIPQARRYLTTAATAPQAGAGLRAEVDALLAVTALLQGDVAGTTALLTSAAAGLPPASPYEPIVLMTRGLVGYANADLGSARRWMQQAYQASLQLENTATLIMAQGHYADLTMMGGDIDLAEAIFQQLAETEFAPEQLSLFARACQGLMDIHWRRGQPRQAQMMAQRCIALATAYGLVNFTLPAWLISARAHQLLGETAESEAALQQAKTLNAQFPNVPGVAYLNHVLRWHIGAGAWSQAAALAALSPLDPDMPEMLLWLMLAEALAVCWLWLCTGRAAAALDWLARIAPLAERAGHRLALNEVWVLRAMAQAELGRPYSAALNQALELAAASGDVVVFHEKGARLTRLLRAQGSGAFAGRLLDRAAAAPAGGLLDPLTAREQELLELIAAGLANQAIADRLSLSLSTVKWHLNNLYSKLGARRRTEALVKARQLGLIL